MQKTTALSLLIFACVFVEGCNSQVSDLNVEPVSFSREDELIGNDDFIILADRRVFTVMAFMNACGYDTEFEGKEMHPVRIRVREAIQAKANQHPDLLERWKQYYKKKAMPNFGYLDFVFSLNDDYPFRRIRPNSELQYPNTAKTLADLPAILNEFWETLELEQIWGEVKPDYIAEINKYDFKRMSDKLAFIWQYLRLQRKDHFTFVSVPNLLDQHYVGILAQYENYWYIVESPGAGDHSLNIHEYLHSIINSLVENNYKSYKKKLDKYFEAGKDLPWAKFYQHPVGYASECLVRALDKRIHVVFEDNPESTTRNENRVAELTEKGFILVQPFYQLLVEYEDSEINFEVFLPKLLERLPEYSKLKISNNPFRATPLLNIEEFLTSSVNIPNSLY